MKLRTRSWAFLFSGQIDLGRSAATASRRKGLASLSLTDLTAESLRLAAPEARRRAVSIDLRFDSPLPGVQADPVGLQRVLLNLVLNGMEAMGEVPAGERRLRISASCVDGEVESPSRRPSGPKRDAAATVVGPNGQGFCPNRQGTQQRPRRLNLSPRRLNH